MRSTKITDALLRKWGTRKRTMPPNAATTEERVLAAFDNVPRRTVTRRIRFQIPRLVLALGVLALIAIVAQPERWLGLNTPTTPNDRQPFALSPKTTESGISGPALSEESTAPRSAAIGTPSVGFDTNFGTEFSKRLQILPEPPDYFQRDANVPITDNRELLETSYSAHVKTRKVDELGSRLQIIIRGFGGRIDSSSLSDRYGNITFALPANKLDALRNELKSLVWKRFLSESVYTENRLGDQRLIEDRTTAATNELDEVAERRAEAKKKYDAREASLNAQIGRLSATLRTLTEQRAAATTDDERASIDAQIKTTDRDLRSTRAALAKMRADRDQEYRNLDIAKRAANERLESAQRDEQTLAGRVATIRGTISLEQLSYSRIATTFLRDHWLAVLFAILAIIALSRMDRRPLIEA
ncbi:MAG: hypothetical protein V1723_01475 [Candidatus Uhrbacteria bacterium]